MSPRPHPFRKSEPKFGLFVIVSLLFHAGLLVFALVSTTRAARANLALNSVYVNLLPPQQFPGYVKTGAETPPEESGSKPMPPAAAETPAPEKAKSDKVALPKEPTKEDLKKDSGSSLNTTLSDSEKKQLSNALSSIRNEIGRKEASGAEAEWQGIMNELSSDIVRRAYCERIVRSFWENFSLPPTVEPDPNVFVRTTVRIDPDGKVMDYQILGWSGNRDLDRAVQRSLDMTKQVPVPALTGGAQWTTCPFRFLAIKEE